MSFFEWYFDLSGEKTEEQVLCPFPHNVGGQEYIEENPSAYVNIEKKLYHCKSCGTGHNESSFIKAITGMRLSDAHRVIPVFNNNESVHEWNMERVKNKYVPMAESFNISERVQEELKLISLEGVDIRFPVFMFNKLLDVRAYRADTKPKCKSRFGAVNGFIVPFDVWVDSPKDRWTLYCAGEKDMAVARSKGFNAITHTGGEQMLPLTPAYFKDRLIAICYDNDPTGNMGAIKLANFLVKHGAQVKVITNFHAGMLEKEDITDYFNKYQHAKDDLILCIENTDFYESSYESEYRKVNLHEASQPQNTGVMVRASIQVVAVSDAVYTMPAEILGTKVRMSEDDKANSMHLNEVRTWALDEDTVQDVLHLVDGGFKEKQIKDNKKDLLRIPIVERNVAIKEFGRHTVYKATVTDLFETGADTNHMPMEYMVYSIGHRLESGKKYTATFKVVPHPYQGQQLTMVIYDVQQSSDSVTSFVLNDDTRTSLNIFKTLTKVKGINGMIDECVERMKGLLGYNGNNTLITTMDLAYHTPLEFHMGRFQNLRAYLDTLIVGESRMGKSSTADTMRKTYGLGMFVSLAGNSATIPGLVGGSNKVGTSYQTKAGIIPQNHKGLMIFEEFGKCRSDLITELTDIRSSNEVRITRVSGTLTLPAMVRMISLSNVKTLPSKEIRSIASYPNGLAVVTELVGSAEDIARYDIMLVLGDKGKSFSDPYWEPMEPFAEEHYRNRLRWVWSRSAEQISISDEVGKYISETANELNKVYDTHIKVFGTEAWKKLARIAIAVAGYTVSTIDYSSILVTKAHVDFARDYMIQIYDNDTFKLKQYVEHERKYSVTDANSVALLQSIYVGAPGVVIHLEQEHKSSKAMLGAASGLNNDQVSRVINQLIQGMFVKLSNNDIIPTERFRLTVPQIQRNTVIKRVGDVNGNMQTSSGY